MFILRTISEDGLESNREIGIFYELVRKSNQEKIFKETYLRLFEVEQSKDNTCFAFLITHTGEILSLYADAWYYIMTETGQTFSKP